MSEMSKKFDIVSVGDCVMDCISYVDRMPKVGETKNAENFFCTPGGKGANVITAGSRLGAKAAFVCKLGNDMFGQSFLTTLQKDNINIENVSITEKAPTSVASIIVDSSGTNLIVVNFGATLELNESDVDKAEETIANSKVLITSMMVKDTTALHALKLAKKHNVLTVFNFAPANSDLNPEFNKYIDVLIVNEVEAEVFIGSMVVKTVEDAFEACKYVLNKDGFYVGVIVTLGDRGCVFGNKITGQIQHFPCPKVNAVDTTGAGDAFVGSLSRYLSALGTDSINQAIELATEYASLSVQSKGTQNSYPQLKDIHEKFKIQN